MSRHSSPGPQNNNDAFDLSQIFIGRQQQLDLFEIYLNRWKQLIFDVDPEDSLVTTAPSPSNKILGFVVLLYGRGGFGKSTLLKHYHEMAQEPGRNLKVSKIIDWEFAIKGKRSIFNPFPGKEVDASDYFRVLCSLLADALRKRLDEFKEYQVAVKAVEDARKQASGVLDSLQKDDRYAELRQLTVDGLLTLIRTIDPTPITKLLDNQKAKEGIAEGVKIGADQLALVYTKLRDHLAHKIIDYLEPALKLGLSLGRDLARFAKDFPLLIFFDTYEEIDEADKLLRLVIGAAGIRVGWVIAGRDNLWAGTDQIKRSIALEYGYKEIISPDRGLGVDFNVGGVGAFTVSDIKEYFDLLCKSVQYEPHLPKITANEAMHIWHVTKGVPLAVKIAAGLYMDRTDLDTITEKVEGKRAVVDQMVRRYLLHAHVEQSERAKLYGLAMLRRADKPTIVATLLGLTPEEARVGYASELSRLHRRYSFIFTEKEEPSLHQEVRYFLRLWLLERRTQPEIVAVNERLKEAHETGLENLELRRKYFTLRERMEDDEWIESYLDLTEQQFWLDPVEGVHHITPFMIAATMYNPPKTQEAISIGTFFETTISSPYVNWWELTKRSLTHRITSSTTEKSLVDLEEMARLAGQYPITFPPLLPNFREELEALLWWKLGQAYYYAGGHDFKTLEWCEKALTRLNHVPELRVMTAQACVNVNYQLAKQGKFADCIPYLQRAIELQPDSFYAHSSLGYAFFAIGEYREAIQVYTQWLEIDPYGGIDGNIYEDRAEAYIHLKEYQNALQDLNIAIGFSSYTTFIRRADVYRYLKEYQRAILEYSSVLKDNYHDTTVYDGRGLCYLYLGDVMKAKADYSHHDELNRNTSDSHYLLMSEWVNMGKQHAGMEIAEHLEQIASHAQQHYADYVSHAIALGLYGRLKEGLAELEKAIKLEPEEWSAYFWKGMLCAYYYQNRPYMAIEAVENAVELGIPPVLLMQLYWLEKDRPDFFEKYAKPLLERHGV